MSKTILLTGSTGFVGKQILKVLLKQGLHVRLVIRNDVKDPIYEHELIDTVVITKDLFCEDQNWWEGTLNNVDTVIHVAWYAEPGQYLYSPKNLECLIGSLQLARASTAAGVSRFIGIGTCFEYDLEGGFLTENTPLLPLTPYAASKAATFMALSAYFKQTKQSFAWCRLFYLYGDGEDERRFVPYLRGRLAAGLQADLTHGKQIRDYLDVQKAGEMIFRIAESSLEGAVNICSQKGITVREFAEQIAQEYGRVDLLRFGVRPENLVDPCCVVGVCSRPDMPENFF